MPEQLKIVIDADVSKGIAGVKEISKVISSDFAKATNVASSAAFDLSKSVAAATARIDSSIDKMVEDALKGTSDISKAFSSIGTVKLGSSNVLATLDEIKAKLSGLDVSIQIKTFGIDKLNTDIAQAKEQLSTLLGKELTINLDATNALQKIKLLETELKDLKGLSLSPNISSTQFELFKRNIESVKGKILELKANSNFVFKADNTQLVQSIAEVQKGLTRVGVEIKKVNSLTNTAPSGGGFSAFAKSAQQAQVAIDNLQKKGTGLNNFYSNLVGANNRAAASFNRFQSSTNTSGQAVLNFGRIIQDSPFGILGVANNINPFVESLQRASAAAKETGTSLTKNLVGALIGPAGIGLAVSAVSSLLIVFGDKLFGAAKSLSLAEIEARKFEASIADIKTGIDQFFSNLEFEQGIEKLKNKLNLGDAAEVFNIGLDKESADKIVAETNEQITKASLRIAGIINNSERFLSKSGQQLAKTFFSSLQTGVTVDTEGLSKADKKIFNILNEQATRIGALQEQNTKARRKAAEADVQIEIQKAADLKKSLDKQKDDFEKFVNETIARAKQFSQEFGNAFVVPDLEESFFVSKDEIFKRAKKLLEDVSNGNLKIKFPVQIATDVDFIFNPDDFKLGEQQLKDLTERFFKDIKILRNIDVGIGDQKVPVALEFIFDPSLTKESIAAISKKLDFRQKFQIFGDLGLKEFNKIFKDIDTNNLDQLNEGLLKATKTFQNMLEVATTLQQALGQGVVGAFNSVFDAILEGKNVFKALGNAVKDLVVQTIKAIAQMLILKAIKSFIFPGGGAFSAGFGGFGSIGAANGSGFGLGGLIGQRSFSNVIQLAGAVNVSGQDLNIVLSRAQSSNGRF